MPKKKTKRLTAAQKLDQRKLLSKIEDERDEISQDLENLTDTLERLIKQNSEWSRNIRTMHRVKAHLQSRLAALQIEWQEAAS